MKNNYKNLNQCERIITIEDFTYGSTVKCIIPTLMPLIDDIKSIKVTPSINNKDSNGIQSGVYTCTNYINLEIPSYLCENDNMMGKKGEIFIGIFLGGDIHKCKIVSKG
ncbi:MAG: hypothetical protein ACRCXT_11380 [Paraclostridium sp.]